MRKSSSSYSNSRNQHTQVNFHHRFMFLLVIFGLFISVIFGLLYYYQIYEHKHYNTLSETNRIKYITTLPTRGNIYDRNGKLLANNLPMYSLDINIEDVKNSDQLISLLKKHIKISNKEIEKFNDRKKKSKAKIVTLKNHLTDSEVAELLAVRHNYSGFQISGSLLRNYNYSKEMSHVLGTVGYVDESDIENYKGDKYQNAKFVGKTGLEKFYNDPLYGNPGFEIVEVDVKGRHLRRIDQKKALVGDDLSITIDANLQSFAYEEMKNYKGAIVALNPKNGEILTLLSMPAFPSNSILWKNKDIEKNEDISSSPLFNRATNGLYSPASTIKPLLGLLSLQEKKNPYRMMYAGPHFSLPNSERKYRDWKKEGHGYVDLNRAIVQSCDVYFYQLAYDIGIDKISNFLQQFFIGQKTGVDMPTEASGINPSKEWKMKNIGYSWTHGETVITGIGQGYMLTTPLQMAFFTSIIANKGEVNRPSLILNKKVNNESLSEMINTSGLLESDWDYIIDSMYDVVNEQNGTAYWSIRNKKNNIAGKTGTVQVYELPQDIDRDDIEDVPVNLKDHSLFVGFAPVDNPEIVVAAVVENVGGGSKYAAPIAMKIINKYFKLNAETQ